MRDYGVVSPKFWTGSTGKALRGDAEAQVLALYLMTCPHASMIGVYHCPVLYMAHETGLSMEGASKALQRLSDGGFCAYDEGSETVFVYRMASFQIADEMKPGDNRIKAVVKALRNVPVDRFVAGFLERYGDAFGLWEHFESMEGLGSPFEPPSKPRTGTGTGTEQDKGRPKRPPITFRRWIADLGDEPPIPENDPIHDYAEEVGIPAGFLAMAWDWFDETYGEGRYRSKRYADWRAVFRNAVRDNWPKLWAFDSQGECYLTTPGKQRERAMAARDAA